MSRFRTASLACVAYYALAAASASAQTQATAADPTAVEEKDIVVTATKQGGRSLQAVPLAIQAFSGEAIKEKNIQDTTALISAIPGASIAQETAAGIKSFNLRGVGLGGTNGETPIGYYLDEVPFVVTGFGIAPPIRFLDLSRIEVLRGPQGTLYGQGSAGGTIIFRTRDPNLESLEVMGEAFGSATRNASDLNWGASGAVSVPIIKDVLAIRVSGGYSRQQGYADLYFGANDGTPDEKDVNRQESSDWRVAALFKPASNVTLRAQIWHFEPKQRFQSLYSSVDPYTYTQSGGVPGYSFGKYTTYSLVGEIDLGNVVATSSTSYLDSKFGSLFPLGPLGFPGGSYYNIFYPKNFNEEVRFRSDGSGPLHWVVGATYNDGKGAVTNLLDLGAVQLDGSNKPTTKNWATFGEISYDLFGGKLVPLVGLRYYKDKRKYIDANSESGANLKKTTYKVNLSYFPNDNLTAFATVSTGFRVNAIQPALTAELIAAEGLPGEILLDPLSLTNYEVGVKARLFDGALSVGANVYRIKYTGIQSNYVTRSGIGGYLVVGDGHSTGVDLELNWRTPIEGLTLSASGNYNDSKYDRVDSRVTAQLPNVRPGGRLLNTASFNYRIDANYSVKLNSDAELFSNINFSQTGKRPTIAGITAPKYELLGATIGLRRGPYEISLFGENLTDERGPTDYFPPALSNGPIPRTVGIRVRANID